MLSASSRTSHPKEVAQFIDFMVHDPEAGRIMGYDRGILTTTAQYDAFKPTDEVNKEIAQYEADTAKAGVLGTITPHPSGADTVEAAFLRIAGLAARTSAACCSSRATRASTPTPPYRPVKPRSPSAPGPSSTAPTATPSPRRGGPRN
ncbi:hypothetical protein GCM10014715_16240 [Streptomyces spiralis]|uniref:Extracellular solute-binding protein n=1 Tax=Streptomyces spiralis TaxID=66376 RepID=A0A918ZRE6_9ACTN|nr:hypothetical protein GCM10014715_16240 [Streptomyces spiralis]